MGGLPDGQPNHIRGVGLVAEAVDADLGRREAQLNDLRVVHPERVVGQLGLGRPIAHVPPRQPTQGTMQLQAQV